jgi:predicted  nucleic acid-binding Zn-ribbon protein
MQQHGSRRHGWLSEQVKAALKDSSWVTVAWDWFQTLLGRAAEAVLWATMVFSCYLLVPGAAQPPAQVSSLAFILQFIALDIGGLGLNKAAQQQGLARWSYARIIAYILIGITLITVTISGIEHAVKLGAALQTWIEVSLVVARSVMTVLYSQAIHDLKHQAENMRERLRDLEGEVSSGHERVSSLERQLEGERREVGRLRVQLAEREQQVDTLTSQVSSGHERVSSLEQQARSGQSEVSSLRERLSKALEAAESAQAQLRVKERERAALLEALSSEQQTVERLRAQLVTEQERVFSLSERVSSGQPKARVSSPLKVSTGQNKVSSSSVQVDGKAVSSVQHEVSSSSVQVDSGQGHTGQVIHLDSKKRRDGSDERMLAEQIRELLQHEPKLSARAIAARLACSPTTAAKWKAIIESEGEQGQGCVND